MVETISILQIDFSVHIRSWILSGSNGNQCYDYILVGFSYWKSLLDTILALCGFYGLVRL